VKAKLVLVKFHGVIAKARIMQMIAPRLTLINRGTSAAVSFPAEMRFAKIIVVTWANENPRPRKKTPHLVFES